MKARQMRPAQNVSPLLSYMGPRTSEYSSRFHHSMQVALAKAQYSVEASVFCYGLESGYSVISMDYPLLACWYALSST